MACSAMMTVHAITPAEVDSLLRIGKDPYYLQLYGGINKSANENLPWTEMTRYPMSWGAFVGLGKELSPLWGWRMALGLDHNKSRNVQVCESDETWGWDDVELFADATFDVTDLLRKNSPDFGVKIPRFNLKAFVGAGALWTFGFPEDVPLSYTDPYTRKSQLCYGVRGGLTATCLVSNNVRLGLELSHTMVNDWFNGVNDHRAPLDHRTNLSVGATWLLCKAVKNKPRTELIYSNRLRVVPELPLIIPAREEHKVRYIEGISYLDFPVNETVIYPDYRRNPEELQIIRASVDSALFDESIQITSISLHGYASPESPYSNNTRLANGRTAALVNFLQKEYGFGRELFKTAATPEDWENLRAFVEACDKLDENRALFKAERGKRVSAVDPCVVENREELLRVIDLDMEEDAKEEVLKQVGGGAPYRWLKEHIYPGLRHTDYVIEYKVQQYEAKDGRRLIYTHPEALSVAEMYQVAITYPVESDGWYDALVIAARQYPNDAAANLNAACASIKARRLKDARVFLDRAGDSADADYVRDVLDAMEGKIEWIMDNGKLIRL